MKLYLLFVLIAICMTTLAYGQTPNPTEPTGDVMQFGVVTSGMSDQGITWSRFYNTNGWNLDKGSGERHFMRFIKFDRNFNRVPWVLATLSGIDADKDTNERIIIWVPKVYCDGFYLDFSTFSDTRIYGATVTWMAIPYEMGKYNPGIFVGNGFRDSFNGPIKDSRFKGWWAKDYNGLYPMEDAGKPGYNAYMPRG